MAQRLILSLLLAGWSASSAALAQPLADPTRPSAASAAPAGAEEASAKGAARLQSVLISRARRVAVIDGRVVHEGERVGDATLVAISESHVVLRGPGGRETLKLIPVIQKKPIPRGGP